MELSQLCGVVDIVSNIGYILIAIAVLMLMIMIHELGHYTAGKILGFKINEFSIGFGKAIYTKRKKNGEVFSIRLVPLGGYCAFEGEDKDANVEGAFNNEPCWKRLIVLFMGAFFNFLFAVIMAIPVLMMTGDGKMQITNVYDNGYNSAIQTGDIIEGVDNHDISLLFGVKYRINEQDNTPYTLTVNRDGTRVKIEVQNGTYTYNGTENEGLGVSLKSVDYGFWTSVVKALPFCLRIAWDCLLIIGMLFTGKLALNNVGGPVTTISTIAEVSHSSLSQFMLLFPLLGVNLAVFNLLPFPALDGARMVFVLIEMIRRKPINRNVEGYIHAVGLMILFAFVIFVDILHFV